jgi:hypothetical protein
MNGGVRIPDSLPELVAEVLISALLVGVFVTEVLPAMP